VRATIAGLRTLRSAGQVAKRRGKEEHELDMGTV
jgi:ribosomal protein S5